MFLFFVPGKWYGSFKTVNLISVGGPMGWGPDSPAIRSTWRNPEHVQLIKLIAKCELGAEKLCDKVAKCEPFSSGKIVRFGYDCTAWFGGDFSMWKNHIVWTGT